MAYSVEYFHARVLAEIESWPADAVLHAFVKKTQETPDRELKLARKRKKGIEHG